MDLSLSTSTLDTLRRVAEIRGVTLSELLELILTEYVAEHRFDSEAVAVLTENPFEAERAKTAETSLKKSLYLHDREQRFRKARRTVESIVRPLIVALADTYEAGPYHCEIQGPSYRDSWSTDGYLKLSLTARHLMNSQILKITFVVALSSELLVARYSIGQERKRFLETHLNSKGLREQIVKAIQGILFS